MRSRYSGGGSPCDLCAAGRCRRPAGAQRPEAAGSGCWYSSTGMPPLRAWGAACTRAALVGRSRVRGRGSRRACRRGTSRRVRVREQFRAGRVPGVVSVARAAAWGSSWCRWCSGGVEKVARLQVRRGGGGDCWRVPAGVCAGCCCWSWWALGRGIFARGKFARVDGGGKAALGWRGGAVVRFVGEFVGGGGASENSRGVFVRCNVRCRAGVARGPGDWRVSGGFGSAGEWAAHSYTTCF